jgi:hypothetical protein
VDPGCWNARDHSRLLLLARAEFRPFFRWAVIGRTSVLLFFIAFVVAGLAPPALILFGLIDFAAAMWTFFAMRSDTAKLSEG